MTMKKIINKVKYKPLDLIKEHIFHNYALRPMDFFAKKHLNGKKLLGVEIGVECGAHANSIIYHFNFDRLYLVDPWLHYGNYDKYNVDESYKLVSEKFSKFKNVVIIKDFSVEASKIIPNCLDYVYIDGNHNYEFVKKDIEIYYPKVRSGGIFGGHDFTPHRKGVPYAVLEFVDEFNLELFGEFNDWWVVKP